METEWILKNLCSNKLFEINKPEFRAARIKGAEIVCPSKNVSREHAVFFVKPNGLFVQDLNSSNGTFVNARKIPSRELFRIKNADIVGLGCTHCTHNNDCPHYVFQVIQRRQTPPMSPIMDVIEVLESNDENPKTEPEISPNSPESPIIASLNGMHNSHAVASTSGTQKEKMKIQKKTVVIDMLVSSDDEDDDSGSDATHSLNAHKSHVAIPTSATQKKPDAVVANEYYPLHIKEELMEIADAINLSQSSKAKDKSGCQIKTKNSNPLSDAHNSCVGVAASTKQETLEVENIFISRPIKEEPMEIPDGVQGYSVDDDVIIIEDDDDFEVNASQLFTNEDRSVISDEKYMQIKTELAELDAIMWPAEPICIESDPDWISDDKSDAYDEIEFASCRTIDRIIVDNSSSADCNPTKTTENEKKTHTNSHINNNTVSATKTETVSLVPGEKGCIKKSKTILSGCDDHEKTTNELMKLLGTGRTDSDDANDTKNLPSTSSKRTSKFLKPPIIKPHKLEVKGRSAPVKPARLKSPPKKRSVPRDDSASRKLKPGNNFNDAKCDTKSLRMEISKRKRNNVTENRDKSDKEEIKEKRRKKLKELENKSNKDAQKTIIDTTKDAKLKCKSYVKISDNRGNFLLDLQRNGSTSINASKVTEGGIKKIGHLKTNTTIKPSTSSSNKIDANFSTRIHSPKPIVNGVISEPSHSNVVLKEPEMIPRRTITDVRSSNFKANGNTNNKRNSYPLNIDAIMCVLNWKAKWAEEQMHIAAPPPVTKRMPVKMCKSFSTYNDYANIVTPLLMLELWENVYRRLTVAKMEEGEGKSPFMFCIEDVAPYNKGLVLKCLTYLTKEQRDKMQHPKESDLIILNIPECDRQQSIRKLFGYVLSCDRKSLRPNDFIDKQLVKMLSQIPRFSVRFEVLIRYMPGQIRLDQYLAGAIIVSMTPTVRLFDSVLALGKSPLCKFILDPKVEDYEVPSISNELLRAKDNLCATQRQIVLEGTNVCLRNEPGIYLIHGPPGTGKTTVIINIVRQILHSSGERPCRILLVAPSNAAVDGIVLKIIKQLKPQLDEVEKKKIKLIRTGHANAINPDVKAYSVDELAKTAVVKSLLAKYPELKKDYNRLVEVLKNAKEELKCLNGTYKDLCANLQKAQHNYDNFAKTYLKQNFFEKLDQSRNVLIEGANIICTTLSSSVKLLESNLYGKMTCCIVDEATQSNEPETLIPLMLGINKILLVGDPRQLSSVVFSMHAKELGLGESLFTRIKMHFDSQSASPIRMLNLQYRMHPQISQYPSSNFYDGQLRNSPYCMERPQLNIVPYYIFNFNIRHQPNIVHYANVNEVDCVSKLLVAIQNVIGRSRAYNVGIITPYNCQKQALIEKVASLKLHSDVTVNTVDSFQGLEKDIIILSCVRYTPNTFLADEKRLNVAITRAKFALYVIGTYTLFENCTTLSRIKDDARRRNLYVTINTELSVTSCQTLILKR